MLGAEAIIFDPLIALLFGTLVGWFVQSVASRLRYNGSWKNLDRSKKRAMSASGSIAALVVGLWILDHPREGAVTPYIYRLWFWQMLAAWLGAVFLDLAGRAFRTMLKSMSGDGGSS